MSELLVFVLRSRGGYISVHSTLHAAFASAVHGFVVDAPRGDFELAWKMRVIGGGIGIAELIEYEAVIGDDLFTITAHEVDDPDEGPEHGDMLNPEDK